MRRLKFFFAPLALVTLLSFSTRTEVNDGTFRYRVIPNKAFTYGERLKYRVHFGWINAATIDIKVDDTPVVIGDRNTYHITAIGKTNRSFDWMYSVRDHFETFMDSQSMAPLKYFKSVRENDYKDNDLVYYDHGNQKLKGHKKEMDMPRYVQDLVSGMFYARTLNFKDAYVGKTFPLDIYMDQEIYNLKFKYLGTETLKTDIGKVRCIKLRPQLVVDRVFKDEDDMTVWVSDDANHVPIRVQTDIWVGSLKIDLTEYKGLANPVAFVK
ncbi:MAG: DUF3108 domain-containing protein [Flavobacteriales bacterium]|nr:DUF3108 domain-containing protein [Flavobacteriales bacterium]